MKTTVCVLLLTAAAALPHLAAEELTKTWNVGSQPDVRVEAADASIEIVGADTSSVQATLITQGYKIGSDVELIEHQNANRIDLRVKEPSGRFGLGRHSVQLRLVVPRSFAGVVRTGDGSIRLSHISGTLRVETGDGSVDGSDMGGALDAHTGDGSMTIAGSFSDLRLRTGDGAIQVTAERGSKIQTSWDLHSGDGSISVKLPKELAADIHLETGDGSIHSTLALTVNEIRDKHRMDGKLNGGGLPLSIRTGDGSISIEAI